MKLNFKQIVVVLPILLLTACSNKNAEKDFELKGKLSNAHGGETLYLEQLATTGVNVMDTIVLNDKGEFIVKTDKVKETGFYRLKTTNNNFTTFIFSPREKVSLTGDVNNLVGTYDVKGSPESELLLEINRESIKNYLQRDSLKKAYELVVNSGGKSKVQIDSIGKTVEIEFSKIVQAYNTFLLKFLTTHNASFASLAAIQQLPIDDFFQDYVRLDEKLMAKYPNSSYVKAFHDNVAVRSAITIGGKAPEIAMNTPEGIPLALSSLKGSVVLIDFWASWCGPCRMENPNVVAAYGKYHSKGFDIFSVSLDKDVARWKDAVSRDNLSWKNHVSDFKGWQSPVVQLYGFSGIPYNVLIDKNGLIIAKNLRGPDLEKALDEVFK